MRRIRRRPRSRACPAIRASTPASAGPPDWPHPLARLGLLRLVYSSAVSDLPLQARAEERAFWSTARHYRSLHDEFLELPTALTQAQALKSLGGKPLIVVTAGKDALTGWLPEQDKMTTVNEQRPPRHAEHDTHIAHRGQDRFQNL